MFGRRIRRRAQEVAVGLERNPGGMQSHHPKHGFQGRVEQGMYIRCQIGGLGQAVEGLQAGDLAFIGQALEGIVFWPDMLEPKELPLEVKFFEWAFYDPAIGFEPAVEMLQGRGNPVHDQTVAASDATIQQIGAYGNIIGGMGIERILPMVGLPIDVIQHILQGSLFLPTDRCGILFY